MRGWRFQLVVIYKVSLWILDKGTPRGSGKERRTSLPSAIDSRKGHESAAKNKEVGEWKGEALPVNIEHFVGVGCG